MCFRSGWNLRNGEVRLHGSPSAERLIWKQRSTFGITHLQQKTTAHATIRGCFYYQVILFLWRPLAPSTILYEVVSQLNLLKQMQFYDDLVWTFHICTVDFPWALLGLWNLSKSAATASLLMCLAPLTASFLLICSVLNWVAGDCHCRPVIAAYWCVSEVFEAHVCILEPAALVGRQRLLSFASRFWGWEQKMSSSVAFQLPGSFPFILSHQMSMFHSPQRSRSVFSVSCLS